MYLFTARKISQRNLHKRSTRKQLNEEPYILSCCYIFHYGINLKTHLSDGVGGIVVSIAAFQAVDPGSIPGRRKFFPRPISSFQKYF